MDSALTASRSADLGEVMRSIATGDRPALATLYERTSAKLYGICLRVVGDEAEAQDVLQEVYVTAWRKADRFDPAKASPITWLAVLARNKSIDSLRRRKPSTDDLDAVAQFADESPSALDIVQSRQEGGRLATCLDELDEKPRAMIRSAFLDGATYPELAARAGVPLGTMKSWIRRGLQRLRSCLEG